MLVTGVGFSTCARQHAWVATRGSMQGSPLGAAMLPQHCMGRHSGGSFGARRAGDDGPRAGSLPEAGHHDRHHGGVVLLTWRSWVANQWTRGPAISCPGRRVARRGAVGSGWCGSEPPPLLSCLDSGRGGAPLRGSLYEGFPSVWGPDPRAFSGDGVWGPVGDGQSRRPKGGRGGAWGRGGGWRARRGTSPRGG